MVGPGKYFPEKNSLKDLVFLTLSNSLVGRSPLPLSPSLLPPPSLNSASLRSAAARATGGGGTLVEGWPETRLGPRALPGLRPLPPHHWEQPPLSARYTSPPAACKCLPNDGRHAKCTVCGNFSQTKGTVERHIEELHCHKLCENIIPECFSNL